MNKKTVLLVIGIVLMAASAVIAKLFDIAGDIPALIGEAFGVGLTIMGIYTKSEGKSTKVRVFTILTVVFAVVSGLLLAFAGLTAEAQATLVSAIFGIVALIATLISGFIAYKANKE
jgi:FtsH-binding integral membrane protein